MDDGKEAVNNFQCITAPIVYSPPPMTSITSIVGEIGSKYQLRRRSKSSVARKSYISDDELDELKVPLSTIFDDSSGSTVSSRSSMKSKVILFDSPIRYELLRDVWMNSE